MKSLTSLHSPRFLIWLVGVSFVLFQFFLQLSSGVIIGAIMQETLISAFTASLLSSAFYYIYTSLQIPAGMLFDRRNTQTILTTTALICSIGCFIFANSMNIYLLFFGRIIIGMGSAFAFVGLSHLLRQHFSLRQFGFLIGLSETLGFVATMFGIIGLGILVSYFGWREFINSAALVGCLIAFFAWLFIPATTSVQPGNYSIADSLNIIIRCKTQWANGCFAGLGFTVITVFGAMWAIPFIQAKLGCSLKEASVIDSMLFLGAAISCPLFGYLNACLKQRKPLMFVSCTLTAILLYVTLYFPYNDPVLMSVLFFMTGISCGSYMLSYTISNEISPQGALSTSTGFTNTLAMLTAPIFQLLTGFLLDLYGGPEHHYNLQAYQIALAVLPVNLLVASCLVYFLPEKKAK
ncbi:MFS transporter [Legionella quinlivanii]|uniref:MFS transporter n=1 Tax=Legionella quinlivanii TaxID=45073 RepID=A0A364LNM2_9GAMM|nr:MFS transporter [Legionella quinlivanii]RAP38635.1 MFS transporter [Legionella quinlivanii]